MRTLSLETGKRLLLVLEPGDEVLGSIADGCRAAGIRQAAITTFLGAFRRARLIAGTTGPADPEAPLGDVVEVAYTEGVGSGTVTSVNDEYSVHLHVAVGEKADAARAFAGHLLYAETQYVAEIVLEEIVSPDLFRAADARASGIPTLRGR